MTWSQPATLTDELKRRPHQLGIDEAGRGPVLGSMVYGCAFCPVDCEQQLLALQCADSKTLTFEQRKRLLSQIQQAQFLHYEVDLLSAQSISANMKRNPPVSLNQISYASAIGLIQRCIENGVNVDSVYVDTVGDPQRYQERLQSIFPHIRSITVSKKADSLFAIVSAASIAAKVTRDAELEAWQFKEDERCALDSDATDAQRETYRKTMQRETEDAAAIKQQQADANAPDSDDEPSFSPRRTRSSGSVGSTDGSNKRQKLNAPKRASSLVVEGVSCAPHEQLLHSKVLASGYPGDPVTKRWLQRHQHPIFVFPSLVRFSWAPVKDIIKQQQATAQMATVQFGDEDSDEDGEATGAASAKRKNAQAAQGTHKLSSFFLASASKGEDDDWSQAGSNPQSDALKAKQRRIASQRRAPYFAKHHLTPTLFE